jgi:hypothetical protein
MLCFLSNARISKAPLLSLVYRVIEDSIHEMAGKRSPVLFEVQGALDTLSWLKARARYKW